VGDVARLKNGIVYCILGVPLAGFEWIRKKGEEILSIVLSCF